MADSKLKIARSAARLTQQQLADKACVHVTQVRKIEGGVINPSNIAAKNLLALAKSLGVSPYDLL